MCVWRTDLLRITGADFTFALHLPVALSNLRTSDSGDERETHKQQPNQKHTNDYGKNRKLDMPSLRRYRVPLQLGRKRRD